MRRTYTLHLKVDFEDKSKFGLCEEMLRRTARTILTKATLLADNKKPVVALESADFFEGEFEVDYTEEDADV